MTPGLDEAPAGQRWLDRFPKDQDVALISENRPYFHPEGAYDDQYGIQVADESGRGIANLLKKFDSDLSGPVLELGCGTGKATVGLCKSGAFPWYLITDSSKTFIDITRRKLQRNAIAFDNIRFAVLSDADLDRLPPASLSAIVLRSALHHFTDVPRWIEAAARTLRPGGTLIFEEPCSPGYLLMGLVAKVAATASDSGLRREQREQAALLAETMKSYHRRDVDKSSWEDKHIFRPDEMIVWGRNSGLVTHFLPNSTFENYAYSTPPNIGRMDFEKFVRDYLHYCMGFGEANAASIAKAGKPYLQYVTEACRGTSEPYLLGIFLLQKAARSSGLSMKDVESRNPEASATADPSWPLSALPSLGRVVLMAGANPHVYRQLRRCLPAGAQLFVLDSDLQRLREPWAGSLGRGGTTALFFRGGIERFFRELPIVPSAVLIEFGTADEGQGDLIDQLRSRVAEETSILIYGEGIESALELGRWSDAGFLVREVERSHAVIAARPNSGEVKGLEEPLFRLGAARHAKALFGTGGSAASGTPSRVMPVASLAERWPFAKDHARSLPATMPDGSPWPRISIVTPSFNQGAFIEETILSIANQGYPNLEHIVIDGGSTDETKSVLERHSDLLAYWESEPDRGQSHAINKGMERATGEILTWLNSDDRLAPGALAAVAMAFHYSKADVVAGVAELYQDDKLIGQHITACGDGTLPLDDILDLQRCWYAGQFFYQPEVMFTRAMWERAGGRVDETLFYSMDYELWVRFAEAGARLHVVGRPVAQFRMHTAQKTHVSHAFMAELETLNERIRHKLGKVANRTAPKPRKLKITLVNDVGFHHGAGIAHQRLAQALAWTGASMTALSFMEGPEDRTPELVDPRRAISEIERAKPDLVILGNLHSAKVPLDLIDAIASRWPTYIVMHDFWTLTGRCAYTGGCEKLIRACDAACPTAEQYPVLPRHQIAPAWRAKRRLLTSAHAPVLLANSSYAQDFARRALGLVERPRIEPIRLGVPTDVFAPYPRAAARRIFDIQDDAFVILVAATAIDDPRKGGDLLSAALRQVRIPELLVVAAGLYDLSKPASIPGLRRIGYVDEPRRMALLYSAADLFVGPSREETFGQVYVEAAACGTPSVAFRAGGVVDAIKDGISGVLVPEFSVAALADAIRALYSDPERRRRLSVLGRIFVENEFSLAKSQQSVIAALLRTGLLDSLHLPRNASMQASIPLVASMKIERGGAS
jgi:glycosyltransferase involved in cell wall biosynthesis/SAM-dependent methyltransferase